MAMLADKAVNVALVWAAPVDVPWFLAGAMGVGVPIAIVAGAMVTENVTILSLVSFGDFFDGSQARNCQHG